MSNLKLIIDKKRKEIPVKIAMIYAFFSALWIVFSDRILLILIDDIKIMSTIQTLKGWLFILITTLLIFNLLKREFVKVRKLEDLMIKSEKMLSLSDISVGLANEINNPLAGIVQNAQVLKNRLLNSQSVNVDIAESVGVDFTDVQKYVKERDLERIINSIIESSHKASGFIDSMLSFSMETANEHSSVQNIPDLLDNAIDLFVKDSNNNRVKILKEYKVSNNIKCIQSKMHYVFTNLLLNAIESMSEMENPIISVRISKSDKFLIVEIEDSGTGISDKIKDKIFEPFFTTKDGAKGMGLSLSYFIVTEIHKGYLSVETNKGKGSKFIIHLPLN